MGGLQVELRIYEGGWLQKAEHRAGLDNDLLQLAPSKLVGILGEADHARQPELRAADHYGPRVGGRAHARRALRHYVDI